MGCLRVGEWRDEKKREDEGGSHAENSSGGDEEMQFVWLRLRLSDGLRQNGNPLMLKVSA